MSDERKKREATERVAKKIVDQHEKWGRPMSFDQAHRKAVSVREDMEKRRDTPRPTNDSPPPKWDLPFKVRDISERKRR